MKKDIKISDKLLSWVFGCECEFDKILSDEVIFISNNGKVFDLKYVTPFMGDWKINIHTFIHLAKIKAFEFDYTILEYPKGTELKKDGKRIMLIRGNLRYNINQVLQALEWVTDKIGGKGE